MSKIFETLEIIHEDKKHTVLIAKKKEDDQNYILKILKVPEASRHLMKELEINELIESKYVLKALEVFQAEGGDSCLLCESFPGKTLENFILEEPIDLLKKLQIGMKIAEGLGDIHHQQVTHKNINPNTILTDNRGNIVKIYDFRSATTLSRDKQYPLIHPAQLEENLYYISPEQTGRISTKIDYRGDIYSLGVVLYYLFTNLLPFRDSSPFDLINSHLSKQPTPPHKIDPVIPEVISNIILKCMEKDPDMRYTSAFGLKKDLEKCYDKLQREGEITTFQIGKVKVYDHFHYPSNLFGRDHEINLIKSLVMNTSNIGSQLLCISGLPGMGKSSIVEEWLKPTLTSRGQFIIGKYNQFTRGEPYSGWRQAIAQLVMHIFSEKDEIREQWKRRISEALGENAEMIVDIIPELKKLIGKPPSMEHVKPQERENRLFAAWLSLIKALLSHESILVIIHDDVHLADESSLRLLEYCFKDTSLQNLLMIVTYTETELAQFHKLKSILKRLEENQLRVTYLKLYPLQQDVIREIIQDSFYSHPKEAEDLAKHLHNRSNGNPFYLVQLLRILCEKNLLYFDKSSYLWKSDLEKIKELPSYNNFIDFMLSGLESVPEGVIELLKCASVIGVEFPNDLLSEFSGLSPNKTMEYLLFALHLDLVVQDITIHGEYKFNFIHERIQQGIYMLIPPDKKKKMHYDFGLLLLNKTTDKNLSDNVIAIVNQLNRGSPASDTPEEKRRLLALNLKAGKRAMDATSYFSALQFLLKAKSLFSENCWVNDYRETISTLNNLCICRIHLGEYQEAEEMYKEILKNVRTKKDKIDAYVSLSYLYSETKDYNKYFEVVKTTLDYLGQPFNFSDFKEFKKESFLFIFELLKVKIKLIFWKIDSLKNLKKCEDEDTVVACMLLADSLYMAHFTGNMILCYRIVLHLLNLILTHGWTPELSEALIHYAAILSSRKFPGYEAAYKYGYLGYQLKERIPHSWRNWPRTQALYYYTTHHLKHPYYTAIPPLTLLAEELFKKGLGQEGVFAIGACSSFMLYSEAPIPKVLQWLDSSIENINKYSFRQGEFITLIIQDFFLTLKNQSYEPKQFVTEQLRDGKTNCGSLETYQIIYKIYKIISLYLLGQHDEAMNFVERTEGTRKKFPALLEWTLFELFSGLVYASHVENGKGSLNHQKALEKNLSRLKKKSKCSPANVHSFELLLRAEWYRVDGKLKKSQKYFEKLIQITKHNDQNFILALAYEKYGNLHRDLGLKDSSGFFLRKAYQKFNSWGAEAKCNQLGTCYRDVFCPVISEGETSTDAEASKTPYEVESLKASPSWGSTDKIGVDLEALLACSSELCETVHIDKIWESLLLFLGKHSGAERIFVIINPDADLVIGAEMVKGKCHTYINSPISLEKREEDLCFEVVKKAIDTKSLVVIENALHDPRYRKCNYVILKKPKSILCKPLVDKDSVVAILYLESREEENVFHIKKLQVLQDLFKHASRGIENAKYYGELKKNLEHRKEEVLKRNIEQQELFKKIQVAQEQIFEQEKFASIGLLTSGIAHELKNPLNFVINFAKIGEEELFDLTEELVENGKLSEEQKSLLEGIQDTLSKIDYHGKRADGIIKGMLIHSRSGSQSIEDIDLNTLLDQALNLSSHYSRKRNPAFNPEIHKKLEAVPGVIQGLTNELIRVFINIMDNAFYYMNEKMTIEKKYAPIFEITTAFKGDNVIISFKDNGIGINQEVLANIFKPFFTTKPIGTGTGLGLAIVSEIIVQQQKGNISVDSEPGKYTTITLSIPRQLKLSNAEV